MLNNVGYCKAVEHLLGIEVPPRTRAIRVIISEVSRIIDHLVCIGANLVDVGAMTNFWYCFALRERAYQALEGLCGARLTSTYVRIGGVSDDLQPGFIQQIREFIKELPGAINDVLGLVRKNRIFLDRMEGVCIMPREDALSWGYTGPCLRASGVAYDLRKAEPYDGYDDYRFDVPTGLNGDSADRFFIRFEEIIQSMRIIEQALDKLPDGPIFSSDRRVVMPAKPDVYGNIEALMNHFMLIYEGIKVPKGEAYTAVEGANGELGFYVVSDGSRPPLARPCQAAVLPDLRELHGNDRGRDDRGRDRHARHAQHHRGGARPMSAAQPQTAGALRLAASVEKRLDDLARRYPTQAGHDPPRALGHPGAGGMDLAGVDALRGRALRRAALARPRSRVVLHDVPPGSCREAPRPGMPQHHVHDARSGGAARVRAEEARHRARRPHGRREVLARGGRVPRGLQLGARRAGQPDLSREHDAREAREAAGGPAVTLKKVLTEHWGIADSHKLAVAEKHGAYEALKKVLRDKIPPAQVIAEVKASGLRGRGGAGFPTGQKWSFVPQNTGKPIYLCINADESEPGTNKDREIMERDPHQLIEGSILASYAINAKTAFLYIRGEFDLPLRRMQEAVAEAEKAGYLGKNVLGSGVDIDFLIHRGAGAYICGEETALLTSLEGNRGEPKIKPPFPAVKGAFGCPTIVNNVESIAAVPWIMRNGAAAYSAMGTEKSKGTKVISVSGRVKSPGNYEIELGYPLKKLLDESNAAACRTATG